MKGERAEVIKEEESRGEEEDEKPVVLYAGRGVCSSLSPTEPPFSRSITHTNTHVHEHTHTHTGRLADVVHTHTHTHLVELK